MSIHILSVLGTSLYEPVLYKGKRDSIETEFIQLAIINEYREELRNGGKVTIFVTDGSEKRNWNDRIYNDKDVEFSRKWTSSKKNLVKEDMAKKGLRTMLKEHFHDIERCVECVRIPDMKTEGEIWTVFENIYKAIDENDEIVFDITHSFRSIPMLAVTVINYAKILKNCRLNGIYYGAYEGAVDEGDVKQAPIIDLTVFNEILEWTYAAESFVNYGNVDKMKETYKIHTEKLSGDEKRTWSPIKKIIDKMENVALGITTCRGADSTKLLSNDPRKSVKQSYIALKESVSKQDPDLGKEIVPMMELIKHATYKFNAFDCEKDYEIGIQMVKWSVRYNMIQQGYTALEETIKTFVCELYDIDDVGEDIRDGIVGNIINACKEGVPDTAEEREELFNRISTEDKMFANMYNELDEDMQIKAKRMVMELPKELFNLAKSVKNYRNDINHMGFRHKACTSQKLKDNLEVKLSEFERIVDKVVNVSVIENKQ